MSCFWKPKGYSSVSPYLVVTSAPPVIDFLQEAFDARVLRRFDRPDGSMMHVELQIEDTTLMLGEATSTWTATLAQVHIYVQDASTTHERAIHAGGTTVLAPTRKEGDTERRAGVKDPAGNIWWIATVEV